MIMFFRFACTIVILTAVSLIGIRLEKENLAIKREISDQHDELQQLNEERCRLMLEVQKLNAPSELIDRLAQHPDPAKER